MSAPPQPSEEGLSESFAELQVVPRLSTACLLGTQWVQNCCPALWGGPWAAGAVSGLPRAGLLPEPGDVS